MHSSSQRNDLIRRYRQRGKGKKERNEDDALVLERRENASEAQRKKIVAFNQYLLLVRPCCVSFATTVADDFQNNVTLYRAFSLVSLSLVRSVFIPTGRQ